MDFSHIPEGDRPLYQSILQGMRELSANLAPMFGPMLGPMLLMAEQQVASVSPQDLRAFLTEARAKLDQMIGDQPAMVAELAPEPAPAELATYVTTSGPVPDQGFGEWFDPATRTLTIRRPTTEDAVNLAAAIEQTTDPAELLQLAESGRQVMEALAEADPTAADPTEADEEVYCPPVAFCAGPLPAEEVSPEPAEVSAQPAAADSPGAAALTPPDETSPAAPPPAAPNEGAALLGESYPLADQP